MWAITSLRHFARAFFGAKDLVDSCLRLVELVKFFERRAVPAGYVRGLLPKKGRGSIMWLMLKNDVELEFECLEARALGRLGWLKHPSFSNRLV